MMHQSREAPKPLRLRQTCLHAKIALNKRNLT
ncbi:hypothetical protein J3A69_004078 [Pseudomonas putida]|jgi:hypothetical protein|nr:hypothetical protein L483_05145 [Pseudomonas putida H8234]MBP2084933.1 hypothetical protein [Pseudomonas sp. PvP089]MBP2089366.1 hypothetical protein [Pseudomonas sp. PvP088]MBP2224471.1 hypothetical protein [Pseudomonas putida]